MLTIVLNDSPVFPEDDEEDGYQVNNIKTNPIKSTATVTLIREIIEKSKVPIKNVTN